MDAWSTPSLQRISDFFSGIAGFSVTCATASATRGSLHFVGLAVHCEANPREIARIKSSRLGRWIAKEEHIFGSIASRPSPMCPIGTIPILCQLRKVCRSGRNITPSHWSHTLAKSDIRKIQPEKTDAFQTARPGKHSFPHDTPHRDLSANGESPP
jgi:hypothetical protein